jgi:cellulose synthase/poly-beta-1,6-N-acetylglucosamine synthase-like glycosyltransferase/peptidoglycan/xylan/chitin deacetylase (PgdA/CDA1 family)
MRQLRRRLVERRIERPPAHWGALAVLMLALFLLLASQGIAQHLTGQSGTPQPSGRSVLPRGQAIFAARGQRLVPSGEAPGRRVSLTFDDGPDQTWTPRIAALLSRLHVPATFFVIGDRVAADPGVVSALHEDGFEIGGHTFTHSDLSSLAGWQRDLQLSLTDSAIAGAAGVRPRFIRPPYSATPAAVDAADERAYAAVARRGYLIALADYDSEDWREPGVGAIVRAATPPGRRGGVILMHDGGGDRSQTLAALRRLVPELRGRGFRFVPLSALAGIPRAEADPRVSGSQQLRGEMLIGALRVAGWIVDVLAFMLVPIALLAVLRAALLVGFARRHARSYSWSRGGDGFAPPASIVVPAFDEADVIEASVRSLAASDYPEFEVIVVDDGSSDGTGEIVRGLGLEGVTLIAEENRGKPDALNAGIAAARHELIVCVDADTVFEPGTLRRLLQPFIDERVGAVAGNTKVANRGGLLGRWQHIDYVMGFNLDRRLFDVLQCMPTVPGAIGAFRRQALDEVGRFSGATLAEDTDITIALGRVGWRVVYAEDAIARTEAPSTLAALWRQRYRWSYGTLQAVWKHRRALAERGEGRIGRVGIPYLLLFQVLLPLLAPLIDAFALYGLIFLDPWTTLAYWLGFNALLSVLAVYAFRLDREPLRPLWAMPLQQFVYRQLMYLVVIQSVVSAARGARLRWQHVERTGELEGPSTPVPAGNPGSAYDGGDSGSPTME